ncbi:unnamed protein product, partial [Rotaria socialis]
MNDTDSNLQAYADIQNDGSSSLTIDSAELISGDVNIRSSSSGSSQYFTNNFPSPSYDAPQ